MCAGCLTSAEALIVSGTAAAGFARSGLARLADRRAGRPTGLRARVAYEHNARFLAEMGHDPAEILGAPPEIGTPGRWPRVLEGSARPSPAGLALGR